MSDGAATHEEPADDDMTPAERESWLRDRGVLIETAVDRRRVESILSSTGIDEDEPASSSSEGGGGGGRPPSIVEMVRRLSIDGGGGGGVVDDGIEEDGIKFVFVPHDDSRPVSTLVLPGRIAEALGGTAGGGDVLPSYIRSYFADGKSIDVKLFEDQAKGRDHHTLLGGGSSGGGGPDDGKIRPSSLESAASGGSVETFPLVRPSSTNGNEGVAVYLDEVGLLKRLPSNRRASSLAARCGFLPAPNFYGDVFVGRTRSVVAGPRRSRNVDITREDVVDGTSAWMVRAPGENAAWQRGIDEITGRGGGRVQPDHAGTEGVAVLVEGGGEGGGGDGGGGTCSYSWLQNGEEIEITISLKERASSSSSSEGGGGGKRVEKSSVRVAFQPRRISVRCGVGPPILEVESYSRLDVDGCTWTLDGDSLVITCEKASEGEIWPRLEI